MNQTLDSKYIEQVKTIIDIIPFISGNSKFAIKGGTAINLFLLDLPRLSVDIDLCYLPLTPRDQALNEIGDFIRTLSEKLIAQGFKTREKKTAKGLECTLFIQSKTVEVKVEINMVVRGSVYPPAIRELMPEAKERFRRNVQMQCLNINDLFGGKICAALDRQHPRDFFDLYMYLNHYSYTRELHQTFMVYLLSSKRPLSELIQPNRLDIRTTYDKQFSGMTSQVVDCQTLETIRDQIIDITASSYTDEDKEFLLSFKRGNPKWELFPITTAAEFPSVKWKLHNIRAMGAANRLKSLKALEKKLGF